MAHAQEIISGNVDDGIMARKHNVFRLHRSLRGQDAHVFHARNPRLFKNRCAHFLRAFCKPACKRQRVKPGLIRKAKRSIHREGELCDLGKHRIQPKAPRGLRFISQSSHTVPRIHICRTPRKIACNPFLFNKISILLHCRCVALGIFLGLCAAELAEELCIDQPMLCRHLPRGAARRSAADRVRLQNTARNPALAQAVCQKHAGQPAADDGCLRFHVARKLRAARFLPVLFPPN